MNKKDLSTTFNLGSSHLYSLGHIAWLWTNSPLHKDWPLALLAINVIPAVHHKQFMLITQKEMPIAYCSWANLNWESEKKYLSDVNSLTLDDWISGNRMWIVDWITPFGHSFELYRKMKERFPNSIARAIRIDSEKKTARVQEIIGPKTNKKKAREQLNQYFDDIQKLTQKAY